MKQRKSPVKLLLLALALVCCLSAGVLLVRRAGLERANKTVTVVASYEDVTFLAGHSDRRPDQWLAALKEAGLQGVLLTPAQFEDLRIFRKVLEAELMPMQVGGEAHGENYFFSLRYDESHNKKRAPGIPAQVEALSTPAVVRNLKQSGSLLVLVEKEAQTGLLLPEGFDPEEYPGPVAKGYWLNIWCQDSVGRLGYEGAEETENILFRGVVDRGIQVLWLAPIYTTEGELVSELSTYTGLISGLGARLSRGGYSYGLPQGYPPLKSSLPLLFFAGLGVILACLLLLRCVFPLKPVFLWILLGCGVLENALGLLIAPSLQITLLCLAAAACFPCLSVVLLWKTLAWRDGNKPGLRRLLLGILACLAVSLLGALLISALQSSRSYLIVYRIFRGVKLSQMAVYGFSLLYFAWMYFHSENSKPWQELRRWRGRGKLLLGIGLGLLVLAVGALYVLRSGDRMISVSVLEQRIRNRLEEILVFRPRTKEFLMAWPLLGLACSFSRRGKKGLSALCGAFAGVGFASLVNTFCHSRAPLRVSLARTGLGLLLGFFVAALAILVFRLFRSKKQTGASK